MKNIRLIFSILIVFFLLSASSIPPEWKIYVSKNGSDDALGTLQEPIATLNRAHELAASRYGKQSVTIYLREGKYYLTEPLVFTEKHSGTKDYPVKITSYNSEKVVLSTSALLNNLDWKPHKDNIQSVKIEQPILFDQLFINGQNLPMARYPNFDAEAHYYNGFSADALSPERIASWKNPKGGYIHALHRHEWGGYQYQIEGKDEKGELILSGGYQNNRQMGMHPTYRMVENVFEELDAPGEWYFDKDQKTLYVYPPQGVSLKSALIESPQAESFFVIEGSPDKPVKYINIEGMTFEHTLRTFMKTEEQLLRSDWAIYRGAAILFKGAENCIVKNCDLKDLGGNAIFFSGYNRNCRVSDNHIEHIGASAISFVGLANAVRSPLFEYNESPDWANIDLTPGPATEDYPADCIADNNLIHNIGLVEKQVTGVQMSMARRITVSHNSIYRMPRAGINVSEGTWGGHLIEWNDVFDTVLETGDHGSFNSWGRDRFWFPKRADMDSINEAHPGIALLDAMETTIIRNNRWRCDHGWDIDLDDGSSNYHIYNNVCLNGGLKLREGFNRTVENNIMINNSFHPHVWFKNSEDVFRHNIVMRNYYPIRIPQWGSEVDYNLFPDSTALSRAQTAGTDIHSLAGNPLFIDPVNGDYRVTDNSPALAVGFKNFSMDQFGVQNARLKPLADTPILPELAWTGNNENAPIYTWLGGQVKNLSTQGERSATGMDGIYGVLVVNAEPESDLFKSGIRANDVILKFNTRNTETWTDLEIQVARTKSGDRARLIVFRNQSSQVITFVHP